MRALPGRQGEATGTARETIPNHRRSRAVHAGPSGMPMNGSDEMQPHRQPDLARRPVTRLLAAATAPAVTGRAVESAHQVYAAAIRG